MPIPVLVFSAILLGGLLIMALTRSQWADELSRLGKHHRRMLEKHNESAGEVSIFLKERTGYLAKILAMAGLESKYEQMRVSWICTSIGFGLVMALIAYFIIPELTIVGFIFGLPLGAGAFVAYLKQLAKKRQNKITEQLPQVLETMASGLRAGAPIMECFRTLSETAPDPIKSEFKRGLVSLQIGKPFRDTLQEMSYRIRTPDFKLLTSAIFISQDVGGNLADVIACIADALRERFKLRDYLNALTAQGKATAVFIGCLPYGITLMTYLATPGYIVPFFNNFWARIITGCLIVWELVGFWILMKLTTFEV